MLAAHPKGSPISKYINSPHDDCWVKDTNNEGGKDSNFTLGLQRECDKVMSSISPTIHSDSTLERNPLQFALAHTNVTGRHYLKTQKSSGEKISKQPTHMYKKMA